MSSPTSPPPSDECVSLTYSPRPRTETQLPSTVGATTVPSPGGPAPIGAIRNVRSSVSLSTDVSSETSLRHWDAIATVEGRARTPTCHNPYALSSSTLSDVSPRSASFRGLGASVSPERISLGAHGAQHGCSALPIAVPSERVHEAHPSHTPQHGAAICRSPIVEGHANAHTTNLMLPLPDPHLLDATRSTSDLSPMTSFVAPAAFPHQMPWISGLHDAAEHGSPPLTTSTLPTFTPPYHPPAMGPMATPTAPAMYGAPPPPPWPCAPYPVPYPAPYHPMMGWTATPPTAGCAPWLAPPPPPTPPFHHMPMMIPDAYNRPMAPPPAMWGNYGAVPLPHYQPPPHPTATPPTAPPTAPPPPPAPSVGVPPACPPPPPPPSTSASVNPPPPSVPHESTVPPEYANCVHRGLFGVLAYMPLPSAEEAAARAPPRRLISLADCGVVVPGGQVTSSGVGGRTAPHHVGVSPPRCGDSLFGFLPPTQDLFVAQLPFDMPLSTLQYLSDCLAGGVSILHTAPHVRRSKTYDGCAFVKVAACDVERFTQAFHKAVLFDVHGLWFCRDSSDKVRLEAYCKGMQQKSPEERRSLLTRPIPFSAMSVEIAKHSYNFCPTPSSA